MHAATQEAFFDELDSIYELEKDSSVRDVARQGLAKAREVARRSKEMAAKLKGTLDEASLRVGVKGMQATDKALEGIQKVPVVKKFAPKTSLDAADLAQKLLT
jgi:hypothetical protein